MVQVAIEPSGKNNANSPFGLWTLRFEVILSLYEAGAKRGGLDWKHLRIRALSAIPKVILGLVFM